MANSEQGVPAVEMLAVLDSVEDKLRDARNLIKQSDGMATGQIDAAKRQLDELRAMVTSKYKPKPKPIKLGSDMCRKVILD